MLTQLSVLRSSLMSKRTRTIVVISFVVLTVLVLTLVPQVTVWACGATGTCPCPGC